MSQKIHYDAPDELNTQYFTNAKLLSKRKKIKPNYEYYFSIAGSRVDGFHVHFFKKLDGDAVTSAHQTKVLSLSELIEFLKEDGNHIEPKTPPTNENL